MFCLGLQKAELQVTLVGMSRAALLPGKNVSGTIDLFVIDRRRALDSSVLYRYATFETDTYVQGFFR
jgi:hypothetical protein